MIAGSSLTECQRKIDNLRKDLKAVEGVRIVSSMSQEIIAQTIQKLEWEIEKLEGIQSALKAGYKEMLPIEIANTEDSMKGFFGPDPRPHKFFGRWILGIGISAWVLYSLLLMLLFPEGNKLAIVPVTAIFAIITTMVSLLVLVSRNNESLKQAGLPVYESRFFKGKISSEEMKNYEKEAYKIHQEKVPFRSIKVFAPREAFKKSSKEGTATIFGEIAGHYFLIAQLKIG